MVNVTTASEEILFDGIIVPVPVGWVMPSWRLPSSMSDVRAATNWRGQKLKQVHNKFNLNSVHWQGHVFTFKCIRVSEVFQSDIQKKYYVFTLGHQEGFTSQRFHLILGNYSTDLSKIFGETKNKDYHSGRFYSYNIYLTKYITKFTYRRKGQIDKLPPKIFRRNAIPTICICKNTSSNPHFSVEEKTKLAHCLPSFSCTNSYTKFHKYMYCMKYSILTRWRSRLTYFNSFYNSNPINCKIHSMKLGRLRIPKILQMRSIL